MIKKIIITTLVVVIGASNSYAKEPSLEERVKDLEAKIAKSEKKSTQTKKTISPINKAFIPDISLILNGAFRSYSNDHTHIRGFQVGHHSEKGDEGFSLGETELNISSNIDDKFFGSLTIAVENEHGEDKLEIEEAFIRTTSLPYGATITAGRMLPVFGYLNERHVHTDDFYDRPLPYRAFISNHYIDDGVQMSVVLPTDFYSEIGGGIFRGASFPADSDGNKEVGSYNAFAKVGGDIGVGSSWLTGFSYLHTKAKNHGREDDHGHNHGKLIFDGKDDFYAVNLKYTFSPNGNNREQEFALQGEYIVRDEKGKYDVGNGFYNFDSTTSGWYLQSTYKFLQNWRIGYRYSELNPSKAPSQFSNTLLDSKGHKPKVNSLMGEWNNSEFSRIRLQYNYDKTDFKPDNQVILQYSMSFGVHGAHSF